MTTTPDYGPYETETQLRAAGAAIYAAIDSTGDTRSGISAAAQLIEAACSDVGVRVGAAETENVILLAGDPELTVSVIGWIRRAHAGHRPPARPRNEVDAKRPLRRRAEHAACATHGRTGGGGVEVCQVGRSVTPAVLAEVATWLREQAGLTTDHAAAAAIDGLADLIDLPEGITTDA